MNAIKTIEYVQPKFRREYCKAETIKAVDYHLKLHLDKDNDFLKAISQLHLSSR